MALGAENNAAAFTSLRVSFDLRHRPSPLVSCRAQRPLVFTSRVISRILKFGGVVEIGEECAAIWEATTGGGGVANRKLHNLKWFFPLSNLLTSAGGGGANRIFY